MTRQTAFLPFKWAILVKTGRFSANTSRFGSFKEASRLRGPPFAAPPRALRPQGVAGGKRAPASGRFGRHCPRYGMRAFPSLSRPRHLPKGQSKRAGRKRFLPAR